MLRLENQSLRGLTAGCGLLSEIAKKEKIHHRDTVGTEKDKGIRSYKQDVYVLSVSLW
jgi:hypothetical protein